jgi:hypothetical protein
VTFLSYPSNHGRKQMEMKGQVVVSERGLVRDSHTLEKDICDTNSITIYHRAVAALCYPIPGYRVHCIGSINVLSQCITLVMSWKTVPMVSKAS